MCKRPGYKRTQLNWEIPVQDWGQNEERTRDEDQLGLQLLHLQNRSIISILNFTHTEQCLAHDTQMIHPLTEQNP